MANETIKKNIKLAIEEETTQGTAVSPTGASSFISPLADGLEVKPDREFLERGNLVSTIGTAKSKTGIKAVSGAIPVEMKAGDSFAAPEYGLLIEGALGTKRSVSSEITSGTSHTTDTIYLSDTSDLNVNDIILVKESGAYHVSPITAISANTSITLLVAADNAFSDNVVISKVTNYAPADSGHPSFTVSKYVEDAVLEQAAGCMISGMTLENFTTGQYANLNFSFEGMSYTRTLTSPSYTPSLDSSTPPVVLSACVYQDGTELPVNDFSLSLENTLGKITSTCSSNGTTAIKVTGRKITGTINPYKKDNDIAQWTKFDNNTLFSLFAYAYNPTSTSGEFEEVVAFYMPNCQISEIAEADKDGVLQDALSFVATSGEAGDKEDLIIATM